MGTTVATFEELFVVPKRGRTLIVGSKVYEGKSDIRKKFSNAIGVDMLDGKGVDIVHNMEAPLPKNFGKFAHVVCLSVLEHSAHPWRLSANVQKCMEREGTLYLSVPTIWRYHPYPKDYWRFTADALEVLFPRIKWQAVKYCNTDGTLTDPPKIPRKKNESFAHVELYAFGTLQ